VSEGAGLLELQDVHAYYGNIRALKGVSLSVARGEIVTLIGSNGAGKTTTLRTVLGTVRALRGTVSFDGRRIDNLCGHRVEHLRSHFGADHQCDPACTAFVSAAARPRYV
jgi:ABC-type branched-subunit amino acid transport system ATPase component